MTTAAKNYDVADLALADDGQARIDWADRHMPVLASIRERFGREKPLDGIQLGLCLHVTTETANLVRTLTGDRRVREVRDIQFRPAPDGFRRGWPVDVTLIAADSQPATIGLRVGG